MGEAKGATRATSLTPPAVAVPTLGKQGQGWLICQLVYDGTLGLLCGEIICHEATSSFRFSS